ncbi:MAG: hypothetical protein ACFFE8_07530 [Candidatus Heimdallarchaeota archaeon]
MTTPVENPGLPIPEAMTPKRAFLSPNMISVNIYRFGERGPEPVILSEVPFFANESDYPLKFHFQLAARYMTALGHEGAIYGGSIYRLPVPGYPYFGLVYPFSFTDPDCDPRYLGTNYGILVIYLPNSFEVAIPPSYFLVRALKDMLQHYSKLTEITKHAVREIHKTIHSMMEKYYSVMIEDLIWQKIRFSPVRDSQMKNSQRIPLDSPQALIYAIELYERGQIKTQ